MSYTLAGDTLECKVKSFGTGQWGENELILVARNSLNTSQHLGVLLQQEHKGHQELDEELFIVSPQGQQTLYLKYNVLENYGNIDLQLQFFNPPEKMDQWNQPEYLFHEERSSLGFPLPKQLSEFAGVDFEISAAVSGCVPGNHIYEDTKRFLIIFLHRGVPLPDIAIRLGISVYRLQRVIEDLQSASFIKEKEGRFYPELLFAPKDDVALIKSESAKMGQLMAERIRKGWDKIESLYGSLKMAGQYPWKRIGYTIVGGELIDCRMLDAFYRDASLMPPKPKRPCRCHDTEDHTTVRYCWMVEGRESGHGSSANRIGKYLPFTFGSYNRFRRQYNAALDAVLATIGKDQEERMLDEYWKMKTEPGYTPEDRRISNAWQSFRYDIPTYWFEDMVKIDAFVEPYTDELVGIFRERDGDIRALFERTEASIYASFGDFFCYYYHLAYYQCIDQLCRDGLIAIPPEQFEYGVYRLE